MIPCPLKELFVLEIAYVFWCAFFFLKYVFFQYILAYLLLIDTLIFNETYA